MCMGSGVVSWVPAVVGEAGVVRARSPGSGLARVFALSFACIHDSPLVREGLGDQTLGSNCGKVKSECRR